MPVAAPSTPGRLTSRVPVTRKPAMPTPTATSQAVKTPTGW